MPRETDIIDRKYFAPSYEDVLAQVWAFYLRIAAHLQPDICEDRVPPATARRIKKVADAIYERRQKASGLKLLKEDQRELVKELAQAGGMLVGPMTCHEVDEWAAALHEETPWMADLNTRLMKHQRAQIRASRTGLLLPPLLLVGKPGNGKSGYARMIGEMVGAPVREIDVGSGAASFRISGVEKGWGTSTPGIPIEMMLTDKIANPVIVVNEVCKMPGRVGSTTGTVTTLTTALLQVLEKDTAARFECPVHRIRFNLSHINWVLTANDLDMVSAPLRDRCLVFEMPEVTPEVAALMFDTLAKKYIGRIDPDLLAMARAEVIAAAATSDVSLRQIIRILEILASDEPPTLH
ncbi:MAG: AAA family ATPase [Loktanella sp.]|nr:AAA family ATPase [Loktanella sp.]